MKVNIIKNHLIISRNMKAITNVNNNYTESEIVHEFLSITIGLKFRLKKY